MEGQWGVNRLDEGEGRHIIIGTSAVSMCRLPNQPLDRCSCCPTMKNLAKFP